jgi:8-oxo-dGTP pyrophosphatase MutT (NUDIX family)
MNLEPTNVDDDALAAALRTIPTEWEHVEDQRGAAVLAAIFARDGEDWLLFTERRADLPSHPGQVSFPGGAREGDEDPATCALRESAEEIGLDASAVTWLGALGNRTSTSTFRVHPLVARIAESTSLTPDPREVASIFAIPLATLLMEERWEDREHETATSRHRPSPHFGHEGQIIWGLTGRLTRDLLAAIRRGEAR